MKRTDAPSFAAALLMFGSAIEAAPIDLTPSPASDPRLDLANTTGSAFGYDYVPVCERRNDSAIFGICGTGSGSNTFDGPQHYDLTYGRLTIVGSVMSLYPGAPDGILPVTGSPSYNLTVILGFAGASALSGILPTDPFSGDPIYQSGLAAYGVTTDSDFDSGTLVTGTPVDATGYGYGYPFGYSGASSTTGTLEFIFNNVGGDFAAYGNTGQIIATLTNVTDGTTPPWNVDFWKTDHSGNVSVGGTSVVPAPAAVWLIAPAFGLLAPWLKRRPASRTGGGHGAEPSERNP